VLQKRQRKGQRLARTGWRGGPHVGRCQDRWNGLGLNGRGGVQAHVTHGALQGGAQAQFREVQTSDVWLSSGFEKET